MDEQFNAFVQEGDELFGIAALLLEINDKLIAKGCKLEISTAKNGYMVSYSRPASKKKLANIVTRKSGMKMRVYAENIENYMDILTDIPAKMKKTIAKAPVCKRLLNPDDCNSRCPMGYHFEMDGEEYKKCRYSAFMLDINEENTPYILQLLENELQA